MLHVSLLMFSYFRDINILCKRDFKGKYLKTFAWIIFSLLHVTPPILLFFFAFHLHVLHFLQNSYFCLLLCTTFAGIFFFFVFAYNTTNCTVSFLLSILMFYISYKISYFCLILCTTWNHGGKHQFWYNENQTC